MERENPYRHYRFLFLGVARMAGTLLELRVMENCQETVQEAYFNSLYGLPERASRGSREIKVVSPSALNRK